MRQEREIFVAKVHQALTDGSYLEAKTLCETWLVLRPEDSFFYRCLATAYFHLNEFALARGQWLRAMEDPALTSEERAEAEQGADYVDGLFASGSTSPVILHQAKQALVSGKYDTARRWCETGLQTHPGDVHLRSVLASATFYRGDFAEARRQWLIVVEAVAPEKRAYAAALASVAYIDAVLEDGANFDRASEFLRRAEQIQPDMVGLRACRGSVLIAMGRLEEGVGLLREHLNAADAPRSTAFDHCLLAIGESRRGLRDIARHHLDAAKRLDPACPLLEKARREVLGSRK